MDRSHQHFFELSDYQKYVIQSSDVIEDQRVYVREETSEKVIWYKERFLTDSEIVENIVENATSTICWSIHRPKRGWYIRLRAPSFPRGAAISLTALPASSPFHAEAALTFSSRVNPSKPKTRSRNSNTTEVPPCTDSSKSSMETITSSSENVVHSYPPTPSPSTSKSGQPPSPATVRAKLAKLSAPTSPKYLASDGKANSSNSSVESEIRPFLLAPHSTPLAPDPISGSLLGRAISLFRNSKPSHSVSFTLCPLPFFPELSSGKSGHTDIQSKRQSIVAKIHDLDPPRPPPLIIFHDQTSAWSFGSSTGLLEIDVGIERELGVDRSFWVSVALAYMDYLVDREGYLAASGG